jgi:hypothetical protein
MEKRLIHPSYPELIFWGTPEDSNICGIIKKIK